MLRGKLTDENNIQYDVTIEKEESKDFDCFEFFNKYVFTYEIKRVVGRSYFVVYRYVLNRYKEILNKYHFFEPYNDTSLNNAAVFVSIEDAKAFLDDKISLEYYLDENKTSQIFKY